MSYCKLFTKLFVSTVFIMIFANFTVFASGIGKVNDVSVNVRSGASTSSKILSQVDTGFKVNILSLEDGFYHITADGFDSAYISAQYVDIVVAWGEVSDERVNLRSQPSTSSAVLNVLDIGKELSVVGVSDNWYVIDVSGDKAYIHKDFVKGRLLASLDTIQPAAQAAAVASKPVEAAPIATAPVETVAAAAQEDNNAAPKLDVKLPAPRDGGQEEFLDGDDPVLASEVMQTLALVEQTVQPQEIALPIIEDKPADVGQSESIYAVVNSNTGLKLRTGPSLSADVVKVLPYGEVLDVLILDDTWTYVDLDGSQGYVSSEFITISRGQRPERVVVTKGQQVITYAKQFLGTPYVYGGNSLTKGVDCSGFVYQVMINFGTKLSRNSSAQYKNGTPVKKADLQTGDLVFFNTTGGSGSTISHVGIYMGNGQFIHSSSSKRTWGITISSLSEAYYQRTYVSACRVLN